MRLTRNAIPLLAAAAIAGLSMLTAIRPVAAQPDNAAELCTPDVMRLCGEFIPDRERIVVCLKAKIGELSPGCRGVMAPGRTAAPRPGAASAVAVAAPTPNALPKAKKKKRHRHHRKR